MGRPLKKSFFGSPATDGKQLVLSYVWLEGSVAAETGYYVVRQVGTGRYQVTNGTKTGVVKLVDAMPDAPGEGCIEITVYGTDTREYASKIFNRTVKTFDGNSYKWDLSAADEEGSANLPFETFVTADEEADAIETANDATTHTAVNSMINSNRDTFLSSEGKEKYADLFTVGGGRYQAVGSGVLQWKQIFGEFESLQELRDAIELHVGMEYNKDVLITKLDYQSNDGAQMDANLRAYIPAVIGDREKLIDDLKMSSVQAAKDLGVSLETEAMTVCFRKLLKALNDGSWTLADSGALFVARNAYVNHLFNGITRIVNSVNTILA